MSTEKTKTRMDSAAKSTPNTQVGSLNTIYHLKESGLLGEMTESRTRAEKAEDEPGPFSCARKSETPQRTMGTHQKQAGANVKGFLLVQNGTI